MSKTLYICYFGVREPLVQTQVIPYLREISKSGIKVSLLTFEPNPKEKWTAQQIEEEKTKFTAKGIEWHCLSYHKWPSAIATAYDVFRGAWFIRRLIGKERIDILHGRVHIPTLMGALARKFSRHKPKLLFDIRGFFPEEYTNAGVWPENGWLYRSAKRVEKWLLKESDGFVVLTEKAREILFGEREKGRRGDTETRGHGDTEKAPVATAPGTDRLGRPVEVIPCCVDLNKFAVANGESRSLMRKELGVEDRKVIAYVGSFGGWYMTTEMLDFFVASRERDPKTFVLILTQRDKEKVVENLLARGFGRQDFFVGSVAPTEVPRYLAAADIALSFIKACYSKQSSSPTKIAEYLACGLPIVANRGVGDVDQLIERNGVGVLIDDFTQESYVSALKQIDELGNISEKCRETAVREFDLERIGGERYRLIYNELLK